MTKFTLAALQESIQHWKRLASGRRQPGEIVNASDCALCRLFNLSGPSWADACKGCPVYQHTGLRGCEGTPFEDAERRAKRGLDSPEFKAAAKRELAFLRSLLPTKSKRKAKP